MMAGALEECRLQELFGFGDPAVDYFVKLDLDSGHTGLYLVYHLNWGTFKSESRWCSY